MENCARFSPFCFDKQRKDTWAIYRSKSESGDLIYLSPHVPWPFLLRPELDYYTWVGFAYVHGIMNGEALESAKREDGEKISSQIEELHFPTKIWKAFLVPA